MADDEITEFTDVDPLELHLVGTPANKFAPLMAKSAEKGTKMSKKQAKQLKALRKEMQAIPSVGSPQVTGVNLAGPGSSTIGNRTPATRVAAAFLDGLEARVHKARYAVDAAGSPMEQMRAKSTLAAALRQRLLGKAVVAESARQSRGHVVSPLGPGTTALFKEGSTHTIGEDSSLRFR